MSKKQKRETQEDMLLEKALSLMTNPPISSSHKEDDDDTFGRFIANELRAFKDSQAKRITKWKIQLAIFQADMPPAVQQPVFHNTGRHSLSSNPMSPISNAGSSNSSFQSYEHVNPQY